MRLNAKGTVESFGGRKLIYNKMITRKNLRGARAPAPTPRSAFRFVYQYPTGIELISASIRVFLDSWWQIHAKKRN